MSRPGPENLASEANAWTARRADTWIRLAAGVTVAALAGIAGAISYSHMRELAAAHGEAGWQAHTFPLSVDGIEIVASLVLLADRRTGRISGWLPWAALAAGTTASLAANIAAADAGLVGRVVAGWPAFALLVAVKLLSGLLEPCRAVDRPRCDDRPVPDSGRARLDVPARDDRGAYRARGVAETASSLAVTLPGPGLAAVADDGHVNGPGTGTTAAVSTGDAHGDDRAGTIAATRRGTGTAVRMATGTDVTAMLPAAHAARGRLLGRGEVLTRDSLAAELRRDGHPVRNARVSQLLAVLKRESTATQAQRPDEAVHGPGNGEESRRHHLNAEAAELG